MNNTMKPEAQRIAIAEACGWTPAHCETFNRWLHPDSAYYRLERDLPDYLYDLNAMHEAEASIDDEQEWAVYSDQLANVVFRDAKNDGTASAVWHATAAQRAEAFLRTLGKWESHENAD